MKEQRFTPGPWRVRDGDIQCVCDADPVKQIARTFVGTGVRERAEAEANARLIAAAPDLLAAAKEVIRQFEFIKTVQHKILVEGQTLESASKNWESLGNEYIEFQPLIDAIAKAEQL